MADANDSRPQRPVLEVYVPAAPRSLWTRLEALLDDYNVFAIDDADSDIDGITNAPPTSRRVFFFSATERDRASQAVARELGSQGVKATLVDVRDDGWAERAQRHLHAVQIDDVLITPPWDQPIRGCTARYVVEIEPSMGFGTGHHASTQLAVRALLRYRNEVRRSQHLLDIGTGSGILAITAAMLGAPSVTAIDRDADALANARHNIARNTVEPTITLVHTDLADLPSPAVSAADVVLANLTSAAFERYQHTLAQLVTPSGLLIATGIMQLEELMVRTKLRPALIDEMRIDADEWVALAFRRQQRAPETNA